MPQDNGQPLSLHSYPIFSFTKGFLWLSFQGHKPALEEKENWKGDFSCLLITRKNACKATFLIDNKGEGVHEEQGQADGRPSQLYCT